MQNSGDLPFPFEVHDRSIFLYSEEARSIYDKLSSEPAIGQRFHPLITLLHHGISTHHDAPVSIDVSHGLSLTSYYATESRQVEDDQLRWLHQRCAGALMLVCVHYGVLPPED